MTAINYIKGDATTPITEGPNLICHVCNNKGGWGAGFVLAISNKWKSPELKYRNIDNYVLGAVQYVPVEHDDLDKTILTIANMIAQNGFMSNGKIPLDYEALEKCLINVASFSEINNLTIHMPRIGCGLAGGDWSIVEDIINNTLCSKDIEVYVYDYE